MRSSSDKTPDSSRNLKLVFLGVVSILIVASAILLRQVLTPVIIALVIAYIVDPLLSRLERHGVRRWLATTILYVSILTLLGVAGASLGPRAWNQAQRLYRSVSGLAQDYGSTMLESKGERKPSLRPQVPREPAEVSSRDSTAAEAGDASGTTHTDSPLEGIGGAIDKRLPEWGRHARDYVRAHADEIASRVASLAVTVGRNAAKGLSSAASFVFGLVLVLVFTFFFMLHFQRMIHAVERYIPAAQRERTLRIVGRIDSAVSNFFRGRLLVCIISGVVYVIGLRLSGVDFWLLIGLAGGFLSFIPVIGVILPLIPACAFALLTGHPWASLLGVLVTFSVVQWVVEPVAGTLILSHQVRMHPVTIILALLIGGSLFGVFGLILSVPLAAVGRILGEEFVLPPLREMAEGKGH